MRVLWLGLGNFGRPMAEAVLHAGHDLILPDTGHAQVATAELIELGARALQPGDDVEVCGVCLPLPEDVVEALGALTAYEIPDVVDFTTGHPAAARELGNALRERGIGYVDAPVSGSIDSAARGELTVWAGAREDGVPPAARALLEVTSAHLYYLGEIGQGCAMKLCNQVVHILTMSAIGEGLQLARAAGLDPQLAVESMHTSSADSAMLRRFGPSLVADDFTPRFALALAAKDIRFAHDLAGTVGVDLSHLAQLRADLQERLGLGYGDWNFSSVAAALDRLGDATSR